MTLEGSWVITEKQGQADPCAPVKPLLGIYLRDLRTKGLQDLAVPDDGCPDQLRSREQPVKPHRGQRLNTSQLHAPDGYRFLAG